MTISTVSRNQIANLDLDQLNQKYENAHPSEILAWSVENIATGLVQTSAFNVDDMLITDILYRELKHRVPVIFLDTLFHFRETLELVEKAKQIYDLDLKVYKILDVDSREAFAAKYGDELWEKDIAKFHQLTKIEPLQRGLAELNTVAWITGRRRDQAVTRANMPIFEIDGNGRVKINPLANWTRKQTWGYVAEHGVIYNPLHDQGYPSIGDEPITTPVAEGEDERAGRWRGFGKTECGIHI
ncbi:phosphoadenosine phosphosulfate reductase [Fischerella thermalis]|jgi:phosphoadenosine phosphosulfate reductase|uniref:Phosphoadenosine 5'-phosphosulfate reductase n=1 Tax=Fischerella thermalis JSC-11 TaxID=741277 RepID=G6FPF4_9CYAN|nr:phosphoadenosine phosphosulfate reductase [Fischerella thermalis]PMB11735.1 phosphoadenosine phosphosulfate reductase [Fischerella thermalis CCMEE 5273]EHC18754.1 phosphoadenosine phosphosulfate reductase [Fischerella thermalis JSC-11]PLZ10237.1 phosphoadenosine phosphosulfate reductase [Fischerella thermalis WC119]PLZ11264.1 phosphoadenosine phosphosulfate reductase [Fischerella thermalis WC1110]PLZ11763.1 phosphoadenosine phosphosulfate reductase [Fischerella thermalis WC114]